MQALTMRWFPIPDRTDMTAPLKSASGRLFPFLILIAAQTACTTVVVHDETSGVREATEEQVRNCEFIRTISATSPFYGVFAGAAMNNLRGEVAKAAQASGATHIVFGQHETTYGSTTAHARAYKCGA